MEVKPDVQIEVHDDIAKLLNEYKDMMPSELPKELPLRRQINHRIDLILGSGATDMSFLLHVSFRIG